MCVCNDESDDVGFLFNSLHHLEEYFRYRVKISSLIEKYAVELIAIVK